MGRPRGLLQPKPSSLSARSSDPGLTLAVVSGPAGARAVASRLRAADGVRYVATDVGAAVELERLGIESIPVERYQDLGWVELVNAVSAKVARGWWELDGLEHVAAGFADVGLPVGRMLELPVYHVVAEAARAVLLSRALIDELLPARIVTAGRAEPLIGEFWVGFGLDLVSDAVALVGSKAGLPVEVVETHVASPMRQPEPVVATARRVIRSIRWRLGAPARRRAAGRATEAGQAEPPPEGPTVLVYAEGRHALGLLGVLHEIELGGRCRIALVDQDLLTAVRDRVKDAGIALVDPTAAPDCPDTDRVFNGLDTAWSADRNASSLQTLGTSEIGISLWPLVKFQFDWLMGDGLQELERRIGLARATVAWIGPVALLTPVDTSVNDLAWVFACQASGAPVVTQLHGATYVRPAHDLWGRGEGDVTAVWGELTRAWHLEATQRPPDSLVTVGSPRLDELAGGTAVPAERGRTRADLGVTDEVVVLFLVTMARGGLGVYFGSALDVYDEFFRGVGRVDDVQVVVRSHPAADAGSAMAAASRHAVRSRINPEQDITALMLAADVVVGQPTTALAEAMVLERPVVLWSAHTAPEMLWWRTASDLCEARTADELACLVRELAAPGAAREAVLRTQAAFLDTLAGPRDGAAAARTARLVERVVRDGLTLPVARRGPVTS